MQNARYGTHLFTAIDDAVQIERHSGDRRNGKTTRGSRRSRGVVVVMNGLVFECGDQGRQRWWRDACHTL